MLSLLLCVGTPSGIAANPGYIYYVNWDLGYDGTPVVSNEKYFTKLFETKAGSRVYEGVVEFQGGTENYFRFYSFLQDCDPYSWDFSWKKGNICPLNGSSPLQMKGKSGVLYADDLHDVPLLGPYENYDSWVFAGGGRTNTILKYYAKVDLDKGTLELTPTDGFFVLVNDSKAPDLSHPEQYVSVENFKKYIPEGDLNVYLYSPYKKGWLTPINEILIGGVNYIYNYDIVISQVPKRLSPSEWHGGIVEADFDYYANAFNIVLNADKSNEGNTGANIREDALYISSATDQLELWNKAPSSVAREFPYLLKTKENEWKGTIQVPSDEYRFRFISKLTDRGVPNMVITPSNGKDRELSFIDGYAYSSTKEVSDKEGGFFVIYGSGGYDVDFLITKEGDKYILKVDDISKSDNKENRQAMKKGAFVGEYLDEMTETSKGIFEYKSGFFYIPEGYELRFFSRILPIADDEPEKIGSYTIAPKGDGIVDLSKGTDFEFDIVHDETIGTTPATPFRFINCEVYSQIFFQIDLNRNKLRVFCDDVAWILLPSGTEMPSFDGLMDYRDRMVGMRGSTVDIPAGQFDVWYAGYLSDEQLQKKDVISFDEDPMVIADEFSSYGWMRSTLSCPDWKGGKLYIDSSKAYDLSKLNKVKVLSTNPDETFLYETTPGSLVFRGEIELPQTDANTIQYLNFEVASKTIMQTTWMGETPYTYTIVLGSPVYTYGTGGRVDETRRNLFVKEGVARSKVKFGGYSFIMSNIVEGKFDVTLDLNSMTVELKQKSGDAKSIYESVAEGGSKLDRVKSSLIKDVPVMEFPNVVPGNNSFNFVNDKGGILVPSSGEDTAMIFDKSGVWTGKYKEVATQDDGSRSLLKLKAREEAQNHAKWNFTVPSLGFTDLIVKLDEKAQTITVFSVAHNEGYFIVDGNLQNPCILDLDVMKKNMLVKTSKDVYEGKTQIKDGREENYWMFLRSVPSRLTDVYGITVDYYNGGPDYDLINLKPFGEDEKYAWDSYTDSYGKGLYYAYSWQLEAEEGWYDITYNANTHKLIVCKGKAPEEDAGVEDLVTEELKTPKIIPGKGNIMVETSSEIKLDIYTINGILVRSVKIPVGVTSIDLPAGLYIVCEKKVLVK